MKYRYERKYLVHNSMVEILRNRILPFVKADPYTQLKNGIPEYTVRSIYFDTPNLDSLNEKIEGLEKRRKLRVRSYNEENSVDTFFLEIKLKEGNRIGKNRTKLPIESFEHFCNNPSMALEISDDKYKSDANKFLYYLEKEQQSPINLIVYDREAYIGKFDSGLRITFDKNIQSANMPEISELFSNQNLGFVWPSHFILEIKYFESPMPYWLKLIVQEFELRHQALSKYTEGYFCHKLNYKSAYSL